MMDYLSEGDKQKCFGCRACEEICPQNCIKMIKDDELFLYPKISRDLCIECGLCRGVCIHNNLDNLLHNKNTATAYMAVHKNESIVLESASGGAFWAIAETLFEKNTIIFGVCYDENFNVVHSFADSLKEAEKFRKSKYVQSNTNGSFSKTKQFLDDGKNVIFTGTPCQIAALRMFLGNKSYTNLLTIDIICHGVPNQELFDMYLGELKDKRKILEYKFRNKKEINGIYNSRSAEVKYINDDTVSSKLLEIDDDSYLYAYYTRLCYRPSCEVCPFANVKRYSDITLGDAWGSEEINHELNPLKGVSLIIANTEKGKLIINKIKEKMDIYSVDLEWAEKNNEQLHKPTSFHEQRDKFFMHIKKGKSFSTAVKKIKPKLYEKVLKKLLKEVVKYVQR